MKKELFILRPAFVTTVAGIAVLGLLLLTSGCCAPGECGTPKAGCPSGKCGFSGASPAKPAKVSEGAEITTPVLEHLLASGVSVAVLDARTGKYDDGFRIPGAKNLGAQASEKEVAAMLPSKSQLIVTYCSNLKCPASRMLAKRLHGLGYKNVLEYPFGIGGWREAGKKVVKAK